jgi:hypothetical protein
MRQIPKKKARINIRPLASLYKRIDTKSAHALLDALLVVLPVGTEFAEQ